METSYYLLTATGDGQLSNTGEVPLLVVPCTNYVHRWGIGNGKGELKESPLNLTGMLTSLWAAWGKLGGLRLTVDSETRYNPRRGLLRMEIYVGGETAQFFKERNDFLLMCYSRDLKLLGLQIPENIRKISEIYNDKIYRIGEIMDLEFEETALDDGPN